MSDNWIVLVPVYPHFVPPADRQRRAREKFTAIAPKADEIELQTHERVQFFNCGGNFERILCPSCGAEISADWWQQRTDKDYDDGFSLKGYDVTCCGGKISLDRLVYDWPQAFGRFALQAKNPAIGKLGEKSRKELERILGTAIGSPGCNVSLAAD